MDYEDKLRDAIANPRNMGEMPDADSVGTVGNPECGDMVRLWLKFTEKDGRKVIDRASFQSFGCQTAIAVASMATELLRGKTVDEAAAMPSSELSAPLGPLPPMKLHCGEMVEGALREALKGEGGSPEAGGGPGPAAADAGETSPAPDTLLGGLSRPPMKGGKLKVVKLD